VLDEILLYDLTDSPFCLKARLCLQLKGVSFRRVSVTLGRLRELKRLSPSWKVPVLVDAGEAIADAGRIARHLEARWPKPVLVPVGAEARAYAALLEDWADESLSFIVGGFKWLNPENRAAALANSSAELAGAPWRPLVGRFMVRSARRRYAAWGYTSAGLGSLEEQMRVHLATLATLLEDKPYLLGRVVTLADVAVFAQLAWMERYAERRLLADVPAVADWVARFAALPAVAAALAS
jgi:glutathione S-transferase